jgi:hypothetical protein
MKIISKYKDYYDYVAYQYGVDPLVTIDRTKGFIPHISNSHEKNTYREVMVAICGELHSGLIDFQGKIFWGEDAIPLGEMRATRWLDDGSKMLYYDAGYSRHERINPRVLKTSINKRDKCPIVWVGPQWDGTNWPKLADVNFAGYISPEDMFQKIYSWMSANNEPDTTDKRDDKIKALNAGFDLKKSFRHRK